MSEKQINPMAIYPISLIVTLGGFLFGYDTAVISGAISSLETFFVEPYHLSATVSHTLLGMMVSGALLGCVAGSALGGYFSQKFGRKRSLLLAATLFFCSGIGSALPELGFAMPGAGDHTALLPFIIYRIIGGIGVGLASMLSPLYIAEIAPASVRGKLVSWNQLAIVIGILTVYFVNYYIVRQGDAAWNVLYGWRWMFASSTVPALLFFIGLLGIPESPRWLVMKGKEEQAGKIMLRLTPEPAKDEIEAIRNSLNQTTRKKLKVGIKMCVAGIALSAFQQLAGIQVILYYAPEIFKHMGYSADSAMMQTIGVGITNFSFTVLAIYTVDTYGRKPLLLAGSGCMALCMGILGACFFTHNLGILAVVCVLGFVASFAFSWGPVTWVLLSEMFPNAVRSKIMSITVAVQWITNYLVSSTFPLLDKSSWLVDTFNHAFSFGLFGMMAMLSGIFVWKRIPETKGKSLEEMEEIWKTNARNKSVNRIKK